MIEMRDRLIELLDEAKGKALETIGSLNNGFAAWYADYLLAEGVIVPHCKVGGYVYRICECDVRKPWIWHWEIVEIMVYPDAVVYRDDSDNIIETKDFGKTVFLTREEAERALAERSEG